MGKYIDYDKGDEGGIEPTYMLIMRHQMPLY